MAEPLGPQPDLHLISQSLETTSIELRKRTNLPGVNQGADILVLLHRIDERLERIESRLEAEFVERYTRG
jgi:hypothetical protein